MHQNSTPSEKPRAHQPVFNLPGVVVWLLAIFVAVHLTQLLAEYLGQRDQFFLLTAVIPGRYATWDGVVPNPFAAIYTPISHAFVHGDWTHLAVNSLWLTAFGGAIAKRLKISGFLLLSAICVLGGFVAHIASHWGSWVPMIGASDAVSGYMGAASRFAFTPGQNQSAVHRPVIGLIESFSNRNFLIFVGIWFGLNFLFGNQSQWLVGENAEIAWQAHIGGFLTGVLFYPYFDKHFGQTSSP